MCSFIEDGRLLFPLKKIGSRLLWKATIWNKNTYHKGDCSTQSKRFSNFTGPNTPHPKLNWANARCAQNKTETQNRRALHEKKN